MLLTNRTNLFDEMFRDPFFARPFEDSSSQIMKTDVHEKDGNYLIEMELPGYTKEDITADLQDGYLSITASREENKDENDEKGNLIRQERYSGKCSRSFYVGKDVAKEDIKAAFTDGILKLLVPKKTQDEVTEQTRIMIE